jgi:hypothetical protein
MILETKIVWLIMSKDRQYVAKGTPRNRYMISIDDKKDKKRYLTYSSKGMAESGFKNSGFYGCKKPRGGEPTDYYEAVECEMTLKLIK